ncbi:MAG: flavodoxin family protein [Gemmatimonadota bacterium]|nr:MAG: flavodoxin family protein [Gemmatimonadota bacterium]
MHVLAFSGSPRRRGNSSLLLAEMLRGAREGGAEIEEIIAEEVNVKYCKGCLRCNLLKRCAIKSDDWLELSQKILIADVLVIASPIYFHHLTASMKKILDRFRSFLHVQITENGLIYIPWHEWKKDFVLILTLGSSSDADAQPVIDLFKYITTILGPQNKLRTIVGTRLAIANQVKMNEEELRTLYPKLKLPAILAEKDYQRNQILLKKCYELGKELAEKV